LSTISINEDGAAVFRDAFMDIGSLIQAHGYWVLAAGCLLEGETILLLAGFAAHQGYLEPLAVIAIAWMCGFVSDQFYFWLGRWRGPALLARWPAIARQANRVDRLTERYQAAVIIGVRFAYGLRIAGPMLIGMSPISPSRFALLNACGALVWAILGTTAGWVFGRAAELALGHIRDVEEWLLLGLAAIGAIAWWMVRRRAW
jgi:membrane protein DedA with SNARE-associated domain